MKSFLGNFYRHLAIFSGRTGEDEPIETGLLTSTSCLYEPFAQFLAPTTILTALMGHVSHQVSRVIVIQCRSRQTV